MVKPGYKQTEIGIIPEAWDISSLVAAFPKLEAGVSVNSDNTLSSEYHVLKTSAVHDGVVDIAETKPIVLQDYHRVKCPLTKGSMVISRMNTPALVGECGFVKNAKDGIYLPDRLWQVKNPPGSSFDFEWLNYLLNTKQYRDAVRATATGTSNSMKNISKERLLEIKIPHPPVDEQCHIASILSNLDELIHLVELQISKKKAIKQGAMQELLTGNKRLPGFDATKSTVKLSDVAVIKDGTHGTYSRVSNGTLLLSAKNIFNNRMEITENESMISTDDYLSIISNGFPRCGDVLLSCVGTIGRCCIYSGKPKAAFQRSVAFIRSKGINTKYLLYLLQSDETQKQLKESANASAQGGVYLGALANLKIEMVNDPNEQTAIASVLSHMDDEIERLEMKLEKYRQIKQGMMQQLLTGKIRLI